MQNTNCESIRIDVDTDVSGNVLVVVVLYKRSFKAVPSATRLLQWLDAYESNSNRLKLARCLIYDNSPTAQPFDSELFHERIDVFHNQFNGGTKAAYLYALNIAKKYKYPWILFLDHDTQLPENFFLAADQAIAQLTENEKVCAVVPQVFDVRHPISPSRITTYGRGYPRQEAWVSVYKKTTLTAIASASLISTDALASVLPIPSALVLDHLDHWLFREIQCIGGKIVVSTARVEHSLSVQSMNSIGVDRYRSILAAELVYLQSDFKYSFLMHLSWHLLRTVKLIISTRRFDLACACVNGFFNIVRAKGDR